MEASALGPQKDSVQSIADMTLSAQQLYQRDPLLFLHWSLAVRCCLCPARWM
jgi:hypothetical protein